GRAIARRTDRANNLGATRLREGQLRRQITRNKIRLPWFQVLPVLNVGASAPLVRPKFKRCESPQRDAQCENKKDTTTRVPAHSPGSIPQTTSVEIVSHERAARAYIDRLRFPEMQV